MVILLAVVMRTGRQKSGWRAPLPIANDLVCAPG